MKGRLRRWRTAEGDWGKESGVFFFQAEDGIRVLVRSRGLGDMYKGQSGDPGPAGTRARRGPGPGGDPGPAGTPAGVLPVSYTHLTLATNRIV